MEDKLKRFVEEHRDEFDMFEPRPELWQTICQELPKPKKEAKVININFGQNASFSASFLFMRVAAAVLLLMVCGITLFIAKNNSTPVGANSLAVSEQAPLRNIAPELAEVEAYYTSRINEKKSELDVYDRKVLGLDEQQEIDQELARLDRNYQQLKKELYTTPNTDKVMGAMIQNLQIRIEVLNKQLEILQKIEQLQKQQIIESNPNETSNV